MHVFGPDVVTVMGTLGGLGGGLCGMSMCLSIPLCVITVSFFCALKIPVHYQTEISLCVCEREGERWGSGLGGGVMGGVKKRRKLAQFMR